MAKPENRLVEQAKAGSADAFGQLYAQYAQDLYRFAYYYLGSREEAEDAVQDAVCAAFQGIGALRSVSSFKAWLFSILSNTCKHHIAAVKERRLTTPLEEARRLGESECSEELMLAMELREAIYALSDEERSIVCSLSSAVTKAMKLPKPSPARPVPFVQNSLVPLRSFA